MVRKILVYDNQRAYFELLKVSGFEECQFVLSNSKVVENVDLEYHTVLFFMYDQIELLDFVKLYNEEVPFVLGFSNNNSLKEFSSFGNIQFLNLIKLKNELLADIKVLLE